MSEQLQGYDVSGLCVVGIDPGAVTGFAVWSVTHQKLLAVESGSFWDVVDRLGEATAPAEADPRCSPDLDGRWRVGLVVVEDSRPLPIYARQDRVKGRARDRVCRNVGRVDRDCELWEAWLSARGFAVRMQRPGKGAKWDASRLATLTGWEGRTNEHARDAARLVVGVTARHVERWGQAA